MGESNEKYISLLPILASVEAIFLTGTFAAGIGTLLFTSFPFSSSLEADMMSLHVSFAMLSAVFGIVLFTASMKFGDRILKILGSLLFAFIGIAGAGGLTFYGTLDPSFSFMMSLGFFGAYFCVIGYLFYTI